MIVFILTPKHHTTRLSQPKRRLSDMTKKEAPSAEKALKVETKKMIANLQRLDYKSFQTYCYRIIFEVEIPMNKPRI
jgi:hypothetical protein